MPSSGWAVAENYLYIAGEATGFVKIDGRYQQANWISDKYIVNPENGIVKFFGVEATYLRACAINFETVTCREMYADFLLHRTNSRFMVYHKLDADI